MQIGNKEISLHLDVHLTDRKPHRFIGPWITQWTMYKGVAVFVGIASLFAVANAVLAIKGLTNVPPLLAILSVFQFCSIPYMISRHRRIIAWRAQYPDRNKVSS